MREICVNRGISTDRKGRPHPNRNRPHDLENMIPFITSRTSTWRLLPPRLAGGINGSTCGHSSSVRSLGYRKLLRS